MRIYTVLSLLSAKQQILFRAHFELLSSNETWVVLTWNDRIQKVNSRVKFLRSWESTQKNWGLYFEILSRKTVTMHPKIFSVIDPKPFIKVVLHHQNYGRPSLHRQEY